MRKNLKIHKIKNTSGNWIEEKNLVADKVVQSYKRQFTQEEVGSSFEFLKFL